MFKHEFVANLLGVRQWKQIENRLIFGEVIGKSLVSCYLTHGVHLPINRKILDVVCARLPVSQPILTSTVTVRSQLQLTMMQQSLRYTLHMVPDTWFILKTDGRRWLRKVTTGWAR